MNDGGSLLLLLFSFEFCRFVDSLPELNGLLVNGDIRCMFVNGGGNVDDDSIINEFNLGFMADDVSSFGNDQFGGGIPLDGNNININSGGDNLIESTFIKNQSTNEYECNLDGCNYKTRWRHCIIGHQYLHD